MFSMKDRFHCTLIAISSKWWSREETNDGDYFERVFRVNRPRWYFDWTPVCFTMFDFILKLTISWRWYRECSPAIGRMTPCTIQEATIAPWLLPVYSFRWTVVCTLINSMITSIWPTTFTITRYPVIFLLARWLIEPASWATCYWRSVSIGNDRYGGCENSKLQWRQMNDWILSRNNVDACFSPGI